MTSARQPFCDIDIADTHINESDYNKIILSLRSRANRDLRFSDTTMELTAIELYEIRRYNFAIGVGIGRGEADREFKIGLLWGAILTIVLAIVLWLSTYLLFFVIWFIQQYLSPLAA